MATTTNLGLKKPGYDDFVDAKDMSDNMEAIDNAFGHEVPDGGIIDLIYPVGSIYMSTASTSPAILFGGTWAAIEGKFLIGAGDGYTAGTEGGSATKTILEENMPSHTHSTPNHQHSVGNGANNGFATFDTETDIYVTTVGFANGVNRNWWASYSQKTANDGGGTTGAKGGGQAMDIMPPYLPVYMWKRTE